MAGRSNRRSTGTNAIRGPQSALTDFLASHNISAQQISQDYQRRQADAERQRARDAAAQAAEDDESDHGEDPVERKKRKRKEEMAIMKIKQSKEFKRRKHENGEEQDDDHIARQMLKKAQPLPGQLENCELCEKRFTVTPYSKSGPDGGLLCTKCSKELKDEEKKAQAAQKKSKVAPKARRRHTESDRLMGDVKPGTKSLVEQCVRKVANVVEDIDDFGELPQSLLDRLSQILSKRRVMNSRVLQLFLNQQTERIAIYDCGKLETEDFTQIFTFMPDLEDVNLRFAGQMKDDSLLYMVEKNPKIKRLQLGASNLVSDMAWVTLFKQRGPQLESLKISELNDSLNDETIAEMGFHCKNLTRLKLRSCTHITKSSIRSIAQLHRLEHLSINVARDAAPEDFVELIKSVGPKLKTLSLEDYEELDDTVLETIRDSCRSLQKLRITGTRYCSDRAFASLFDSKIGSPPLSFVDLSSNRDVETANQDESDDDPLGFGSEGFIGLMHHSGRLLESLDLHSCRLISHAALLEVFDGQKQYNMLRELDLSFVMHVDDVVMSGIFRSCPNLTKLAVFACFNARGANIPSGIAVVGLPNAQDNIVINADAMLDL